MTELEILGWVMLSAGLLCVLGGLVFSLLPMLAGPPVSAVAPLLVLTGLHLLDPSLPVWVWVVALALGLFGALLTAVDLLSPALGKVLGRSSRSSMVGAYYGLAIGALLAMQIGGLCSATSLATVGVSLVAGTFLSVIVVFAGPLAGGFVGELAAMPRHPRGTSKSNSTDSHEMDSILRQAALASLAQGGGLLLTTGSKLVYGLVVGAACATFLVWAWLI